MQIEVSKEEKALLREVAEDALKELKVEIRRTSTHEYRDRLKEREELLGEIVVRLSQ